MNIACTSCPAKYGVPDEKVRGRKVRITCKRCGAAIIVDGTQAAPAADPLPEPQEPKRDRERQRTILGGLEAPVDSAPGARKSQPPPAADDPAPKPAAIAVAAAAPKAHVGFPRPGGLPASAALTAAAAAKPAVTLPKVQAKASAGSPAAQAKSPTASAQHTARARPVEVPWTVAVTDEDHRDMPTAQVVEAYAAHTIDAETFIWRDGMEDWLTPFEIPDIAAALTARGLTPRTNGEGEFPVDDAPRARQPSGSWHEPGKWDQHLGDPTFDDVTVAMAAPKAQQLLEAAADGAARAPAPEEESKAARPAPRPAAGSPAPEAPTPHLDVAPPAPSATATPHAKPLVGGGRPAPPREEKRDLFARAPKEHEDDAPRQRMASIPPEPHNVQGSLTGVRNESSVLFSLDQLTGAPAKAKGSAAQQAKIDKVDAEALMFGGGASSDDAPPSVANLGGGALFNPATMAAPDFTAAAAPSAPMHTTASSAPRVGAPTKKTGGGVWIALTLAVLAGAGGAFFLLRPAAHAPAVEGASRIGSPEVTAAPPVAPTPVAASVVAPPETALPAASAPPAGSSAAGAIPSAAIPAEPSAAVAGAHPATTPAAPPSPAAAPTHPESAPKPAAPAAATPKPEAPAAAEGPEFDRAAASSALAAAASSAQGECAGQDGPHGTGKVTITFMNSGRATNAVVSGDFAGSALGGCVARVFRSAKVPPFSGDSVRVNKTVHIP